MLRRILVLFWGLTLATWLGVGPLPSAQAQVPLVDRGLSQEAQRFQAAVSQPTLSPSVEAIERLLAEGLVLERKRRWGEALSHYEDASRRYPDSRDLQQRLLSSRAHFDVVRRYSDNSYVGSVQTLTEDQAIELLAEVVLKIQSHYVDAPNWRSIVYRGTNNLGVALSEESFLQRNRVRGDYPRIKQLLDVIWNNLETRRIDNRQEAQDTVRQIARYLASHLYMSSTPNVLEYVCGATAALDEYSTYLTADQLDEVYSQIEGNFVGLGVELKASDGALLIADVIPNGPANKAGIIAGERIVEVNGQSTRDITTDRAADLLKGEQGSTVDIVVASRDNALRRLQIRRDRVEVPSVEDVKIVDSAAGVGYLRITSFQKTTSRDVDAALWKLHRDGMRSLIIDVRGNPGGLLTESVEVADKFVTDGTIVSTRGRSPREDYDYKAHRVGTWRVPLVVLIDGDSASASEIFAGAIHDHRRGKVVGERSYGKGSVQGIFPLRSLKAGIRLTTAKFYSPSGHPISQRGITPDVKVHVVAKADESRAFREMLDGHGKDAILDAGVRIARQLLAQR